MKTKISPLEELRAARLQIENECREHEDRLKEDFDYLKSNWGSLLVSSIFASSRNSVKSLVTGVVDPDARSSKPFAIFNKLSAVVPFVWDIVEPMVIGLITKKFSSFIFGRKKKHKTQTDKEL